MTIKWWMKYVEIITHLRHGSYAGYACQKTQGSNSIHIRQSMDLNDLMLMFVYWYWWLPEGRINYDNSIAFDAQSLVAQRKCPAHPRCLFPGAQTKVAWQDQVRKGARWEHFIIFYQLFVIPTLRFAFDILLFLLVLLLLSSQIRSLMLPLHNLGFTILPF